MMKQLYSGLGQQNFFAHPVQKATAHVLLQRLHRVAHRRLREVKFLRGEREASRARERRERAQLPGVERLIHSGTALIHFIQTTAVIDAPNFQRWACCSFCAAPIRPTLFKRQQRRRSHRRSWANNSSFKQESFLSVKDCSPRRKRRKARPSCWRTGRRSR